MGPAIELDNCSLTNDLMTAGALGIRASGLTWHVGDHGLCTLKNFFFYVHYITSRDFSSGK